MHHSHPPGESLGVGRRERDWAQPFSRLRRLSDMSSRVIVIAAMTALLAAGCVNSNSSAGATPSDMHTDTLSAPPTGLATAEPSSPSDPSASSLRPTGPTSPSVSLTPVATASSANGPITLATEPAKRIPTTAPTQAPGQARLAVVARWQVAGFVSAAVIDARHVAVLRSVSHGKNFGWELDEDDLATGGRIRYLTGPESPAQVVVSTTSVYVLVDGDATPTPGVSPWLIRLSPATWTQQCRLPITGVTSLAVTDQAVWTYDFATTISVKDGTCAKIIVNNIPPDESPPGGLGSDGRHVAFLSASYALRDGHDTYVQHIRVLDTTTGHVTRQFTMPTTKNGWSSVALSGTLVYVGGTVNALFGGPASAAIPNVLQLTALPDGLALAVTPAGACIVLGPTTQQPCSAGAEAGEVATVGSGLHGPAWFFAQQPGQQGYLTFITAAVH
jgi:hypothetical protein